jgi:small subunit ribosomal protein S17
MSALITGHVVSNKMKKTITVLVERRVKHPVYEKVVTRSAKYHVHDELEQAKVGNLVEIRQSRPMSKTKFWVLSRIVEAPK